MNKLQVLFHAILDRFQALSDQEKKKALIAMGGASFLVVALILWSAWSSLSYRHSEIKRLEVELNQIDSLAIRYAQVQAEQEARQAQIRANQVALFTLIQNVATRLELEVNDLNERKEPLTNSDLVQVSVVVTLKQLSIDRFNAFLETIEDSSGNDLVKVTRLQVKTRFDQPDLLDVQMTVTTWKAS